MSGSKQSKSGMVIGTASRRSRWHEPKMRLFAKIAAVLLLIAVVGIIYYIATDKPLSPVQEQAISTADANAAKFDKDKTAAALKRLDTAVLFALDKKCVEARAVYDAVVDQPDGVQQVDIDFAKKRIDKLCAS